MRMSFIRTAIRVANALPPRKGNVRLTAVLLACVVSTLSCEAWAIGFVQVNSATPQTPQSTVTVTYANAQASGDLNVVVVGWGDTTATVSSVTDSKGNAYQLAVGPTKYTGVATQSIYYAANIGGAAAGANTVSVKFNSAAVYPDIRILEYSGISTTEAFDVSAAAIGSSTSANSGLATTTGASDLLFGADDTITATDGGGLGFTSRIVTNPDGDIAEDATVSAGDYAATAPISPSGAWIMQLVAFKGAPSTGSQPTTPTNLTGTASGGQVNLTWTASTDTSGTITSYQILRCKGVGCVNFTTLGDIAPATAYTDTGIADSSSYTYRIDATDSLGHTSGYSNAATVTTSSNCCDNQPPTAPSSLTAMAASSSEVNLEWTASTDNVGVTSYEIHRCQGTGCANFETIAGVPPQTAYTDTSLSASTSYSYFVTAEDAAGNISPNSNTASTTTLSTGGGGDTQPPTAPTGLTVTVISSSQINLSWTASTDNVGVTGYFVERCSGTGCTNFVQIGSPTSTSYSDTGLSGSTPYSYRVRATDAAHNLSQYSSIVSGTTSSGSGGNSICD
jgi:fibronectin type 3 domain-containing protein